MIFEKIHGIDRLLFLYYLINSRLKKNTKEMDFG
jgi:hypothetical protein